MMSSSYGNIVEKLDNSKCRSLEDVVFSWSFQDALNKDLYKGKVDKIPTTFTSANEYKKTFINPLIEETHADYQSNIENVAQAPAFEILYVKVSEKFKPPKDLLYKLKARRIRKSCKNEEHEEDVLQIDTLIAITDIRPKCAADLNRPNCRYTIASVQGLKKLNDDYDTIILRILSSRPINLEDMKERGYTRVKLFAVRLTNLKTNIRIWNALNWEDGNISIINNVLQHYTFADTGCSKCFFEESYSSRVANYRESLGILNQLDDSQKDAVVNCLSSSACYHRNTVNLLWGPPGTGKTGTVASLLFMLLRKMCRTLTCAPTNIAVVGVAKRLMSLVREASMYGTYGLGDIVLCGNRFKMKIHDDADLLDIFLADRASCMLTFLSPNSGWTSSLESIICLFEGPHRQYLMYCINKMVDMKAARMEGDMCENIMTYEEFYRKTFNSHTKSLISCIVNMYTHLPTSIISVEVAKKMIRALELLETIETQMKALSAFEVPEEVLDKEEIRTLMIKNLSTHEVLVEVLILSKVNNVGSMAKLPIELRGSITDCLQNLYELRTVVSVPDLKDEDQITNFCLSNATLIFCTASTSIKMFCKGMSPVDMLVVDEAAQLKECESTIPLQLSGLRHAVLIGDERQLPAMVQSKICQKANFGRSLFERLVGLGHKKNLLKIQYRMHPKISLFPNKQFYNNLILDGSNVKEKTHEKHFLEGKMFGTYSFVNVTYGKEEFDNSHSQRNMAEVAIVAHIVARLYKESVARHKRVSVGCISPYKAQVNAIKEKLKDKYSAGADSLFSINVSSVDGFQGSESDVIIISTVRSNGNGSIGFLSNLQRANVSLTRARHCLWILGNGSTLSSSGSVWKNLIIDAKSRGCFYDVQEDKKLALSLSSALLELGQFNMSIARSLLFKEAMWKVCFDNCFLKSLFKIKDEKIFSEALSLLMKLAGGWQMPQKDKIINVMHVDVILSRLSEKHVYEILNLIWTVDIVKEEEKFIQVIKVLDVLPVSKIPELKQNLETLFQNYTIGVINRCNFRCVEGDIVRPMTWPLHSDAATKANTYSSDQSQSIGTQLAALSLSNDAGTSTKICRKQSTRCIII